MTSAFDAATRELLARFAWNPWFVDSYWPENEPRIRLMARLATAHVPPDAGRHVLEVGCATGFVAFLFRRLGYAVTALDAYDDEHRTALFREHQIRYLSANLNELPPLANLESGAFDLVLMGEVFEHILNHPTGLLAAAHRLLRANGALVLTTPNPSTLVNAIRLLRDRYELWGTTSFLRDVKVEGGRVIDRGDVHYREYPARLLRDELRVCGFEVGKVHYVGTGSAGTHGAVKRAAKRVLRLAGLSEARLFAPGYVLLARRPA